MKREFISNCNKFGRERYCTERIESCTAISTESPITSISFLAKSSIKIGEIEVGEICLMDSTYHEQLNEDGNILLSRLSSIISEKLTIRREMFLKTTGLMKDILHDVRTPLMALELNSTQLLAQLNDSSIQRKSDGFGNTCGSELPVRSFINTIISSTSLLKRNLDEYSLLQQAYLVDYNPNLKSTEINLIPLVQEAYNRVGSNFFLRKLMIREEDFNHVRVYSHPDALRFLISITLTKLLRCYRKVFTRVERRILNDSRESDSACESIPSLPLKKAKYADALSDENIEISFECEERLISLKPSSHGKDYVISEALGVLLQALNASVNRGNLYFQSEKNQNNYVHSYLIHCRMESLDLSDTLLTPDSTSADIAPPRNGT